MKDMIIIVDGKPLPLKRHRLMGRNSTRMYDPSKPDKTNFLKKCLHNQPISKPFEKALKVDMHFIFERPKSHFGTGKNSKIFKSNAPEYHISTPDLDNLVKFVKDALNKVYWKDDSIIVNIEAIKNYSHIGKAYTVIKINEI